jgi:hypothetical protein
MPELAELPTTPQRYAGLRPWNSETAALAGQRSGQVRRERAGLQPAPELPKQERTQVEAAIQAQLRLVAEQITRTRAVLNDDTSDWCEHCERGGMQPHHRAQLLKALDSLLDRQRKLLGIPDPGSRRPAAEGKRDRAPAASSGPWLPADDQPSTSSNMVAPAVQPPAKPMGWEYDEPAQAGQAAQ